ncbi:hypothetical protein D3C87_1192060 [compost metagenome]
MDFIGQYRRFGEVHVAFDLGCALRPIDEHVAHYVEGAHASATTEGCLFVDVDTTVDAPRIAQATLDPCIAGDMSFIVQRRFCTNQSTRTEVTGTGQRPCAFFYIQSLELAAFAKRSPFGSVELYEVFTSAAIQNPIERLRGQYPDHFIGIAEFKLAPVFCGFDGV